MEKKHPRWGGLKIASVLAVSAAQIFPVNMELVDSGKLVGFELSSKILHLSKKKKTNLVLDVIYSKTTIVKKVLDSCTH